MAEHELRLPKLGMQMVDATIEDWLVADGAMVSKGQDVLVISTDKVETVIEAPASGTIRIVVDVGETVDVGALIAVVAQP